MEKIDKVNKEHEEHRILYNRIEVNSRTCGSGTTTVSLLGDGKLDTLALRQGDPGLVGSDDEDVAQPGSEGVIDGVLDVDNVEATIVTFTVGDDTDTTHVTTTGDHDDGTSIEGDVFFNLAGLQINLDGIVDLDERVRVADCSGIVCDEVWDSLLSELDSSDLAQLVLGLLRGDSVDGESSLGVVDQTEVLAGLLESDDIHEATWEGRVGPDLSVDLDEALHDDSLDFPGVQGVLETVSQEDNQGKAVSQLVRTGRRPRGIGAGEFVEQPVGWRR